MEYIRKYRLVKNLGGALVKKDIKKNRKDVEEYISTLTREEFKSLLENAGFEVEDGDGSILFTDKDSAVKSFNASNHIDDSDIPDYISVQSYVYNKVEVESVTIRHVTTGYNLKYSIREWDDVDVYAVIYETETFSVPNGVHTIIDICNRDTKEILYRYSNPVEELCPNYMKLVTKAATEWKDKEHDRIIAEVTRKERIKKLKEWEGIIK